MIRKAALLLADAVVVFVAIHLAVNLRFEGDVPAKYSGMHMLGAHIAIVAANLIAYSAFGLYGKVWRYAGVHELEDISKAVTLAYVPFIFITLWSGGSVYPRSIVITAWLLTLLSIGAVRFTLRLHSERLSSAQGEQVQRVLIVGANDAGEAILRELARQPEQTHACVGFVDDTPGRTGVKIRGVPVLGRLDDLASVVTRNDINEIVVADPRPPLVRRVVSQVEALRGVELKMVPSVADVVEGRTQVSQMRDVRIEDLLARPPVEIDLAANADFIAGRTVLVTGAGGSIGSEICRQISSLGASRLVLLGRGENSLHEAAVDIGHHGGTPFETVICDVRDMPRLEAIFARHRPKVVFHAAAHKHVPMMETNATEAITVNVLGTRNLVELSRRHGVERFILLSTDKSVNPVSVMGWSKRLAEMVVLDAAQRAVAGGADAGTTRFVSVRFGNVLGSRGSVVPTFRRQIAMGGPVTVTDPRMKRYFMTIPEAVTLVIQAAAMARGGEVYILDMGDPVEILELARNMIRLSGFEPDTDIPIEVRGSRPGEKLDEELLNEGERASPTEAEKIKRVDGLDFDPQHFAQLLAELEGIALRHDDDAMRARLKDERQASSV
ncbi:MAG: polysaccharide biosynthesis protein [Proteobacteria bacterium]|nr:polysaccharide biosynthesis protein [Pseudomonadota bacterium]